MANIREAVAAPFNDFDFIIESFNKSTGLSIHKIIHNLILIVSVWTKTHHTKKWMIIFGLTLVNFSSFIFVAAMFSNIF